ncbi:MAG: hypothetical protein FWF31_11885 [Desulfobulbus sp.]|nr:hypothetical protein [Desulfobulbus sp.]
MVRKTYPPQLWLHLSMIWKFQHFDMRTLIEYRISISINRWNITEKWPIGIIFWRKSSIGSSGNIGVINLLGSRTQKANANRAGAIFFGLLRGCHLHNRRTVLRQSLGHVQYQHINLFRKDTKIIHQFLKQCIGWSFVSFQNI